MPERPPCDCHGVPMVWFKDSRDGRKGGRWYCHVKKKEQANRWRRSPSGRAAGRRYYYKMKARGVCTSCGGPLITDTKCWECLNKLEDNRALSF